MADHMAELTSVSHDKRVMLRSSSDRAAGRPHVEAMAHAVRWDAFEDGFPNLFIDDVERIKGQSIVFLASFHTPSTIFEQLSVLYALPRYLIKSLVIAMPYFPTGTMERIDHEGQVATAMTLARMLSIIPPTMRGSPIIVFYDIHALQERFYFGDGIVPVLRSAIPIFHERLHSHHADEDIAIAFPDEGACKRFHGLFHGEYPIITCTKVRDGSERIVCIKEGEPQGRHVFIVDDMVKTGGTLLQCRAALESAGATQVSVFVTHAVFPQESWRRFEGDDFQFFYTTDSCPEITEVIRHKKPFHILPLAHDLVETAVRYSP